jgi:hypothetical protein
VPANLVHQLHEPAVHMAEVGRVGVEVTWLETGSQIQMSDDVEAKVRMVEDF